MANTPGVRNVRAATALVIETDYRKTYDILRQ